MNVHHCACVVAARQAQAALGCTLSRGNFWPGLWSETSAAGVFPGCRFGRRAGASHSRHIFRAPCTGGHSGCRRAVRLPTHTKNERKGTNERSNPSPARDRNDATLLDDGHRQRVRLAAHPSRPPPGGRWCFWGRWWACTPMWAREPVQPKLHPTRPARRVLCVCVLLVLWLHGPAETTKLTNAPLR